MAINKITEKAVPSSVDSGAKILITQGVTVNGQTVEDVRRATLNQLADALGMATKAAIAPNYADLTFPVKVGQPCWYSGTLYKAKQYIATSESWTAAHWEPAVVGDDLTDLGTRIDETQDLVSIKSSNLYNPAKTITGYQIKSDGSLEAAAAYNVTDAFTVPAGKKIYLSALSVSGGNFVGQRRGPNACRLNTVYNLNGEKIDRNTSQESAYTYTNSTENPVLIRFQLWGTGASYEFTDYYVAIVDAGATVNFNTYEPYALKLNPAILTADQQTLTAAQKAQARENIGVPGVDATLSVSGQAADAKAVGDFKSQFDGVKALTIHESTNLYNPAKTITGYQIKSDGSLEAAAAYNVTEAFTVPAGKMIYLSALSVSGGNFVGQRRGPNACRLNTVYNLSGAKIDRNTDQSTAYKYVNNTENPALVRFQLWGNGASYEYTDYYVAIVDAGATINFDTYEPYGMTLDRHIQTLQWYGKKWSGYGDSITAHTNGNSLDKGWARYVNEIHQFGAYYGRGIGSQSYEWKGHGGMACFINANGTYNSRDNSYNKDNYSGAVPSGTTLTRGAYCSWDRITHMYPASIKDTIDLIFIMGATNDTLDNTALAFVANDTTDPEWAASDYYETYGGDYNIETLRGGIASTIMKMQAWMPQAVIVIGTPCNGQTNSTGFDGTGRIRPDYVPDEFQKSQIVREVAGIFGIPCIDVFSTCGINVLNSPEYITDGTHPNSTAGYKALGRAIAGGLRTIYPNL